LPSSRFLSMTLGMGFSNDGQWFPRSAWEPDLGRSASRTAERFRLRFHAERGNDGVDYRIKS
jgi:hypothetical protein